MKKYLLYDGFMEDLNDAPFQAAKLLLTFLGIAHINTEVSPRDLGYHMRYKYDFSDIFKDVLYEAKEKSLPLVALENSSYLSLQYAKKKLEIDVQLIHVNDIFLQSLEEPNIVHGFSNFNGGIYYGSDDENLDQKSIFSLLKATKARIINLDSKYKDDGFRFIDFDKNLSFKMAGDILFEAYDSSCDFLVVNDIRSFHHFDTHQKSISKSNGRALGDGLPILSIAQIMLMALGKIEEKDNLVNSHTIKPAFI